MPEIEAMLTMLPRRLATIARPKTTQADAGGIHERRDRPHLGLDPCRGALDRRVVANVHGAGAAADLLRDDVCEVHVAVEHGDGEALLGQLATTGLADAAGASGDDGHSLSTHRTISFPSSSSPGGAGERVSAFRALVRTRA